jgi:uncharacterized protein YjbI with pentapeptide repeats
MSGRPERTRAGTGSARRLRPREPSLPDLPAELTAASLPAAELHDGAVHAGLFVAGADLSGREAAGAELDKCRYRDVSFAQGRLSRVRVTDVEFDRCDLANLRARDSSVRRSMVTATRMTGLSWITGVIRDVIFDSCRIDLGYFSATRFFTVVFRDCRLDQANFGDTELSDVQFDRCDLTGAQFSGARLADTRFSGCELSRLSGVTSLRGATITASDAMSLTGIFAEALGIRIEDAPGSG